MISKENRAIAVGTFRLDYKKILNKVVYFLDQKIDGFPQYLKNSEYVSTNEKALNSCLTTYLNFMSGSYDSIETFRFYFDKDTQVEGSNHEPDLGVMLANQKGRGKAFFHIECKRLPDRDKQHEQEYVHGKLGGIQRFKEGKHGSDFSHSAMVGYIEKETCDHWFSQINSWISTLINQDSTFWNKSDYLSPRVIGNNEKHISNHIRRNSTSSIQLYHYWVLIPFSSSPTDDLQ